MCRPSTSTASSYIDLFMKFSKKVLAQALVTLPGSVTHCTVKETGPVAGVEEGSGDVTMVTLGDSPYASLPSEWKASTPSWPYDALLAPRNFFTFPSPRWLGGTTSYRTLETSEPPTRRPSLSWCRRRRGSSSYRRLSTIKIYKKNWDVIFAWT